MSKLQPNFDFRPATYFAPQPLESSLVAKIKAESRRTELKKTLTHKLNPEPAHYIDEAKNLIDKAEASIHFPGALWGGKFLPPPQRNEVEIARIAIRSTTYDVTSVYAKMINGLIEYRVVDEYDGDTLDQNLPHTKISDQPLTLGELVDFFLSAWPFLNILEINFENDLNGALDFFYVESEYYTELSIACTRKVIERYA